MKQTPAMKKLRSLGYTVKPVPVRELPFYLQHQVKETGEHFYELWIGDFQLFHKNNDGFGYFLSQDLTAFAESLPKVVQPTLMEIINAPF
jgi:hypothetical protein